MQTFKMGTFRLSEKQEIFIREKISVLPRQERLAIHFYFWEQYSFSRIALNLSVELTEVPRLLQSAMTRLRGDFFEIADTYFGTLVTKSLEQVA